MNKLFTFVRTYYKNYMKNSRLFLYFFLAFIVLGASKVYSQTQEEIEEMLEDSSSENAKEKTPKPSKKTKEKLVEKDKTTAKAVKKIKENGEEDIVIETTELVKEKGKKPSKTTTKTEIISTPETTSLETETSQNRSPRSSRSTAMRPLKTWSIEFSGGLVNPVTDIRYKDWFGTLKPKNENQWGAGFKVRKMFDPAFGLELQGSYNVVQGVFDQNMKNEENRDILVNAGITDGIYFKNNVVSGSLNLYWNISNTIFNTNRYVRSKKHGKPMKDRIFAFYAFAGIGAIFHNPDLRTIEEDAPARFPDVSFWDVDESKKFTFHMNIPIGLGAKFKLGKVADLGVEYVINNNLTDKLDGFVYNHPNRVKNDIYTNLNVTLGFKIGTKKKDKEHIEWANPMNTILDEIGKIDGIDRKLKRLTTDDDDDGVSDWFDHDTETPEGVRVDGSGKALDSDGDGIPDSDDKEPFSDAGAEVDEFGKMIDSDGDGVPNARDIEPNTKKGAMVNFQGASIDDQVRSAEARDLVLPSVFFDTDKSNIKREYEDELFVVARDILRNKNSKFVVIGHCDERGSEEYNMELGKRRAETVKKYLVENYNIDASRIETVSKGKQEMGSPRFSINRRADILILEK